MVPGILISLLGKRFHLKPGFSAVADAYDAMTSNRPYRNGVSHAKAAAILREGAGTQWDAEIVSLFLDAEGEISEDPLPCVPPGGAQARYAVRSIVHRNRTVYASWISRLCQIRIQFDGADDRRSDHRDSHRDRDAPLF